MNIPQFQKSFEDAAWLYQSHDPVIFFLSSQDHSALSVHSAENANFKLIKKSTEYVNK